MTIVIILLEAGGAYVFEMRGSSAMLTVERGHVVFRIHQMWRWQVLAL